ncbi:MAG: VWA domain-containing protein [Cyclobacteriaceae bacterium]|nr:VWA domain-containing protein [Cyclobacteriaceae bacterium]
MEVDQLIFKRILTYFHRRAREAGPNQGFKVSLNTLRPRLTLLARALTGDSIQLTASEREGGWKDDTFFLPNELILHNAVDRNIGHYIFRVFYLSAQRQLGFNWQPDSDTQSVVDSQKAAKDSSHEVLAFLFQEYPSLHALFEQLTEGLRMGSSIGGPMEPDTTWLYGRWMKNSFAFQNPQELAYTDPTVFKADQAIPQTEIKAVHADETSVLTVDKKAQEDYVLTHNFEKVETADKFNGVWRDFDGDDSLKEDSDALNEINSSQLVRVDDPVHSVYQAEWVENVNIAESKAAFPEGFHFSYPEWSHVQRIYKTGFCKVFPQTINESDRDYYTNTLHYNKKVLSDLRKIFARINNDRDIIRRQVAGDSFDLDAVTDRYADLSAKRTPDDRLFLSTQKRKKELSMLFLLDLSLSSDGYAHGNRIIDVEKQVSILFGEVLSEYEVDFQIDGFFSKTRNYTKYQHLKTFDEPWEKARWKIGAVQPQGYTRIGPALRHATSLLKQRKTRKKWLVLLSDGKPNDYDRYEGKYGIQDVKQALREMGMEGINNFAIAIEEEAKYYLPHMFGDNHYNILSGPVEMIHSLAKLYKRIQQK